MVVPGPQSLPSSRSKKLGEDAPQVVCDIDRCQAVTLDLEGEVARAAVHEGAEAGGVERGHPFRYETGHDPAQHVARPANGHPRVPGIIELDSCPVRHDVDVALQQDRGAECLRSLSDGTRVKFNYT